MNIGWEATRVIVVVGAGMAGLHTVRASRQGYAGPLTLLGAEDEPPYDRPPLSKELLMGKVDDDARGRLGRPGCRPPAGRHGVAVATGVVTDAGEVAFEKCVLATGAEPRRLPGTAATLRTRADAVALRSALRPRARLAIVGAG